ncbi:MAG TPA: TRAP transporter small permease [Candidatus Methylomirabilis sp.]
MSALVRLCDVVEKSIKVLMAALIVAMVVLIASQVGFRYVLNEPLAWTEEVARHLMIWAGLLGAAVAYRHKGHLGMDILVVHLGKPMQRVVEVVVQLLSLGFFGILVIHGIPLVERTMGQFSSAIRIPMGYIYASIPFGSALILLFAVEKIACVWGGRDESSAASPA